ncbi:MAG: hypothetical protein NTW26_00960 [bacterium]|nr:hypothetical protein [bacterium]
MDKERWTMSRVLFVTLCGALLLALGFSAALAGVDTTDWYWDAALGLYISWDDSHQVFFIYDPNADAVWAYEPNMGSYYFYDQAADRLYEVGYAGVDNEGELDLGTNEATVEMMRVICSRW